MGLCKFNRLRQSAPALVLGGESRGCVMKSISFACAMLVAAVPALAADPKWVPLDSHAAKVMQGQSLQTRSSAAPQSAIGAQAAPSPEAEDAMQPPATPQAQVAAAPVTDGSRPLQLTCMGSGVASKATSAAAWGWGGGGFATGHKDRGFNDQVDIRLFTGDDRIRLPRTMLPGLHGGDHGWFKVHDLVADPRAIRASAGVGMLNNPKIFIDRVTGTISISGKAGDYAGQCQVIDASAAPKF